VSTSTLKREMRVALSRKAQPLWFRITKWLVIVGLTVAFWREPVYWLCLAAALCVAVALHLLWRYKTKGWTQPWGGWNDVETANRD
jgi:membrane-bound metal-dependent hydrolase YbcI (DUF457 family)